MSNLKRWLHNSQLRAHVRSLEPEEGWNAIDKLILSLVTPKQPEARVRALRSLNA